MIPALILLCADLPAYVPGPAAPPLNATYLLPDGSISIAGYNDMDHIFANLNALFAASHPGVKFSMSLKGTATGPAALAAGLSALAPMGAEFSPMVSST